MIFNIKFWKALDVYGNSYVGVENSSIAYTFKIEHAPMQIETSLCLPSSVGLSTEEFSRITKVVKAL